MKYNRCMSAALISAILFGAVTPVAADELNDKLQNLQDQIDIIQMDHDLEREQKFDQVLDTITPDDKKSK